MDIRSFFGGGGGGGQNSEKVAAAPPSSKPTAKSSPALKPSLKPVASPPPKGKTSKASSSAAAAAVAAPVVHSKTPEKALPVKRKQEVDELLNSDDEDEEHTSKNAAQSKQTLQRKRLKSAKQASQQPSSPPPPPPPPAIKTAASDSQPQTDYESQSQSMMQSPTLSVSSNNSKLDFQSPVKAITRRSPKVTAATATSGVTVTSQDTHAPSSHNATDTASQLLKPLNKNAALLQPSAKLVSVAGGAGAFLGGSSGSGSGPTTTLVSTSTTDRSGGSEAAVVITPTKVLSTPTRTTRSAAKTDTTINNINTTNTASKRNNTSDMVSSESANADQSSPSVAVSAFASPSRKRAAVAVCGDDSSYAPAALSLTASTPPTAAAAAAAKKSPLSAATHVPSQQTILTTAVSVTHAPASSTLTPTHSNTHSHLISSGGSGSGSDSTHKPLATTTSTITATNRPHYMPNPSMAGPLLADSDPARRQAPNGLPNCLVNLKIAVTGVFNSFSREDIEHLIMKYGGKVANNVSGKTDYVLFGVRLEDGREVAEGSKYRHAVEKRVKLLSENEFLDKIQASNPTNAYIDWAAPTAVTGAATPTSAAKVATPSNSASSSNANGSSSSAGNGVLKPSPPLFAKPSYLNNSSNNNSSSSSNNSSISISKPSSSSSSSSSSSVAPPSNTTTNNNDALWVDKYKPSSTADIIGNADTAKKLTDWLRNWDKVHMKKSMKIPFNKDNPGAKAVLLSGPPGIGKTTVASLIATEMGYDTLELNASDTRSKKAITEELADVVLSQAISTVNGRMHKRLVIMDEVDGMGGSDRGGIPELIKVIKYSKNPIICICNDRQSPKIRSLANHCYDLRVRRPTKQQIAQRMIVIGRKEGLEIDTNAAETLVEQSGNDIRQVINCLQMWRMQSNVCRYDDLKGKMADIEKDKVLRQSPFDACQTILGGQKFSLNERYNNFFIDYSLVPLLVQQNYIEAAKNGLFRSNSSNNNVSSSNGSSNGSSGGGGEVWGMEQLAKAAAAVSDMDLAESGIRGQDQHWELLTTEAMLAVKVGHHVNGFLGFPTFPAWLGKNSTTGKTRRLVHELVLHTSLSISQGFTSMRLDYTPYLRAMLLHTLFSSSSTNSSDNGNSGNEGGSNVDKLIAILDSYGLSREDFMETMKDLQFVVEKDAALRDRYEGIDSKTKSALTRLYNSMEHRSQALASTQAVAKKGKRGGSGGRGGDDDDDDYGMDEDDIAAAKAEEEEEEAAKENDVGDVSAFVKKHKSSAAASKKAAASSSSSAKTSSSSSSNGAGKGKGKAAATKKK